MNDAGDSLEKLVEGADNQSQDLAIENQGSEDESKLAYLHTPIRKTAVPYTGHYQVEFEGVLIVRDSRDPETDLARALASRGMIGPVKMIDATTGKHRTTVNIEKAARRTTVETGTYPRFRRAETCAGPPYAGQTLLPGGDAHTPGAGINPSSNSCTPQ
jgi:hypothetical protein